MQIKKSKKQIVWNAETVSLMSDARQFPVSACVLNASQNLKHKRLYPTAITGVEAKKVS
jgi:hypothetical protein